MNNIKDILKTGMKVLTENGSVYTVVNDLSGTDYLLGENNYINLDEYDVYLLYIGDDLDCGYDIKEVYEPSDPVEFFNIYNTAQIKDGSAMIWSRDRDIIPDN